MNAAFDVTCIVITTPRLVLREWRQSDLNDFYEYAKVDGVGQMAGWPPHETIQDSQRVLNNFMKEKKVFAIYHKEDKKVVGSIGVEKYSEKMKEFDYLKGREIGFVLSKAYWGQGLMPEAVKALCDYLFKTMRFDFLTCGHFCRNSQSKRVQEKCGFVPYRRLYFDTVMRTKEEGFLNILLNPSKKIRLEASHRETLVYPEFVKTDKQMWKEFCMASGVDEKTPYEAWAFGSDNPNKLASLVLKGEKTATTSVYELYEFEGEEIPKVGEYSVVLNKDGYAVCVIRDTDVEVKRFCDVDGKFAQAEGEGDKSLKYWRSVHREVFTPELKEETGRDFTDDTKVVCETFEVVYK